MPPSLQDIVDKPAINHRLRSGAMFLFVVVIAVLWVLLFQLNAWIFSGAFATTYVSWIFLPAALRMIAVMVGDWAGALGLFFGALITNFLAVDIDIITSLILASLSALGPVCAVYLCTRWLHLPNNLLGLQRTHLLVFATAGAIFNVFPHNMYFYLSGLADSAWEGVLPMLVGDIVGTLFVLYAVSFSFRLARKLSAG